MARRYDDKFDSPKLIPLRTFNGCAICLRRVLSKRWDESDGRIPRGMLFYAQYLARDGSVAMEGNLA